MGEDAAVGSSTEPVFRNHRFLLFPWTFLFLFVSCQGCPRHMVKQIKFLFSAQTGHTTLAQ